MFPRVFTRTSLFKWILEKAQFHDLFLWVVIIHTCQRLNVCRYTCYSNFVQLPSSKLHSTDSSDIHIHIRRPLDYALGSINHKKSPRVILGIDFCSCLYVWVVDIHAITLSSATQKKHHRHFLWMYSSRGFCFRVQYPGNQNKNHQIWSNIICMIRNRKDRAYGK